MAENEEKMTAREYQTKLLEIALECNSIIYLPTGSGKTYIAIQALKRMAKDVIGEWGQGAKRSAFLCNSVALAQQQSDVLKNSTNLKVKLYVGQMNVDNWKRADWDTEFKENQVLVCTTQILLDCVRQKYISLTDFNLLVFDECHHATGNHAMHQLMQQFQNEPRTHLLPRVIGLTGVLVKSSKECQILIDMNNLEAVFRAKIITVENMNDFKNVLIYSTKPKEMLVKFKKSDITIQSLLFKKIENVIKGINHGLEQFPVDITHCRMSKNLGALRAPSPIKKIQNLLLDFLYHYQELGAYAASISMLFVLSELEYKKRSGETETFRKMVRKVITACEWVRASLISSIFDCEPTEQITVDDKRIAIRDNCTPKLWALLHYLFKEFKNKDYKDIKCLLFVHRRYTARIIHYVLNDYIGTDMDFLPLKSQFIVGKNKVMPECIDDLYDDKYDKDVMAKFRRSDVNLVVCSSVLEEGIDIQECNYVIMFDEIRSFNTYVQTKGRARMSESFYIIFTSEEDYDSLLEKVAVYQRMDKLLKDYLIDRTIDRTVPTRSQINQQFQIEIEPYLSKIGARLEGDNVVPLLYRYFMCLPNDNFTTSQSIRWKALPTEKGSRVSLQLPLQSTIKETIISDVMANVSAAKRSAAMKACIKLYENNELTDHLVPVSNKQVLRDLTDTFFPHWEQFQNETAKVAGTKKNVRLYDIYNPIELYSALPIPNQKCYIYEIVMKHHFEDIPSNKHLIDVFESERTLGILSSKIIPLVADFPLFMHQGQVSISIKYRKTGIFVEDPSKLLQLKSFHRMIFKDILKIFKYFMSYDNSNEENSYLCVPLTTSTASIDWNMVYNFQNLPNLTIPSKIQKMKKVYKAEDWIGKVIQPWYSNKDQEYMVVKVHEDLSPLSPFPKSDFKSFKDFVEKQYGEKVERTDMFMIEVKAITKNMRFFAPGLGNDGARKKARNDYITMFIPELCHNSMFPGDFWVKCRLLPSVLYRLKTILIAEKLRRCLNEYVGISNLDYSPAKLLTSNITNEESENENLDDSVDMLKTVDRGAYLEDLARDQTPQKVQKSISALDSSAKSSKFYKRPIDISRCLDEAYVIDFEYAIAYINQQLPDQMHRLNLNSKEPITPMDMDANLVYEKQPPLAICDTYKRKDIQILKICHPKTPEQRHLLAAITAAGAVDNFNMERDEVLGDAFLKFSISIWLMHKFPNWNEGHLSTIKGQIVSNQNLLYLAIKMDLNLPGMINPTQFEPNTDWAPPLISVPKNLARIIKEKNLNSRVLYDISLTDEEIKAGNCTEEKLAMVVNSAEPNNNETSSSQSQCFINKQSIPDKIVADCIEAVLGTTLQYYGIAKNFEVLRFFGIIKRDELNPALVLKEKLVNPRIKANISNIEVDQFLINHEFLENNLNYQFRDRAYLLTALTHPSYPTNRITGCYQQLEFLGDAILDLLITCYIFEQNPEMNPGQLTDLRMSLVNNVTLSCLCVRNQFQKHMLFENAALLQAINNFENFQKEQDYAISSEVRLLKTEDESVPALGDYVDVPKALGDIVEALIGAVFLDSNNDLETCWKVIYHLFKDEIHKFSISTPIQVVRELYEHNGANPKFSEAVEEEDIYMVKVTFTCRNKRMEAVGFGKNSKQAQQSAAKSALVYLQQN